METGGSWELDYADDVTSSMATEAGLHLKSHHVLFGVGEEEGDDEVLMLSDDDLSWSGELLLSSRRPPQLPHHRHQQQLDLDDDDDDDVAWDQLELDPDPTPAASQSPSRGVGCGGAEDNDGPSISSASSYASSTTTTTTTSPSAPAAPQQCRHDPDEHSRWLRETNAFLQEAMVYLVGSIALKTQKDERRALQCFRKAHELGHARGTFRVGLAHLEGTGGVEKGEELAKAYLRESLDQFVSHQIQDSDYYGNFRQYLENDFRHGALRHPLVLDLLQLYAEQSEDIKKVVDFALERNSARRRNITIAGNLPIFGTAAAAAATATCGTPSASHHVSRDPTECCRPEATQPAEDEAATTTAATTTTTTTQQQQQTDEEGTENGRGRGKKSKKGKKEKKEKVKKEKSEKRAKEKETRRERKKSSGTDKKTDRELKKERKRLEREDKEREKERRREEKKARRSEKDAARRTKEDERRALKRQPSKKINNAEAT